MKMGLRGCYFVRVRFPHLRKRSFAKHCRERLFGLYQYELEEVLGRRILGFGIPEVEAVVILRLRSIARIDEGRGENYGLVP